jgi:hypothetical protein
MVDLDPDYVNKTFSTIPDFPNQLYPKYYGVKKYPNTDKEFIFMQNMKGTKSLYDLSSKQIENIPQSAYKELYDNIEVLKSKDVGVDYKGDNILYNPKDKKFVLVDLFEGASKVNDTFWKDRVLKGIDITTSSAVTKDIVKEQLAKKIDRVIFQKGSDLIRRYPESGTSGISLSKVPTSNQGDILFSKVLERAKKAKNKIETFKSGGWLDNI